MARVPNFCARHPFLVLIVVVLLVAGAMQQIRSKLYVEPDLTKFLPKNLITVKTDDYYRKNFNYQDTVLVGVEADGSVFEPRVLRFMERVVLAFKSLTGTKTFHSLITGKDETVTLPVGVDVEDVQSVANLEDVILDPRSGALITGSIIQTLKDDTGLVTPPGQEDRLPADDAELARIIPALREHVMRDRLFRGLLVSEDERAATIQVPMLRKWDLMRRYIRSEFATALSEDALRARFRGEQSEFPHAIFGRTLGGIAVDDAYVKAHVARTRTALGGFLRTYYRGAFDDVPRLRELLDAELTPAAFQELMALLEGKDLYQHPALNTWETSTNDLYNFLLESLDPFSRDNLEFLVYDPRQFVEVGYNYLQVVRILDENATEGIRTYAAGYPVVIALLSIMMRQDMGRMLPLAILVVIGVLLLSFRSTRGVVIPFVTVALSVVFALATMAISGTPMTITSFILPIVLLAIGTAYGIHVLNRYNEDYAESESKLDVLDKTYRHVGLAVAMAAVTTLAGFLSLATSSLLPIIHFGIISALGVGYALILTFTLTPALLALWRPPRRRRYVQVQHVHTEGHLFDKALNLLARSVILRPRTGLAITLAVAVVATVFATRNTFEGDPLYNFLPQNPIWQSDRFMNSRLSGTYNINLVIKFRPEVNLTDAAIADELRTRTAAFGQSWSAFAASQPALRLPAFERAVGELATLAEDPARQQAVLMERLALVRDTLNEEFRVGGDAPAAVASASPAAAQAPAGSGGLSDLDTLVGGAPRAASQAGFDNRGTGLDARQVAGLDDLRARLGLPDAEARTVDRFVLAVRRAKSSPAGIAVQRTFSEVQDLFAVDVKQPIVLRKLEQLYAFAYGLETPQVHLDGQTFRPIGRVITPVDIIGKIYRVFFHDGDYVYDGLPDVRKDRLADPTLTDRAVLGTIVNQALSSNRDNFNRLVRSDLREMSITVLARSGVTEVVTGVSDAVLGKARELFPADDPYIAEIAVGGQAPRGVEITNLIAISQAKSIAAGVLMVGLICLFLYRSFIGGVFAMIPLTFTILLNFGVVALLGVPITAGTAVVASIAIGTGVDYTIHFLERFKIQVRNGDDLQGAYLNTIHTSGKAIVFNALSVALGFAVLLASDFRGNINMGLMMMGTMVFSSIAALTTLPALILVFKPRFLARRAPLPAD